VATAFDALGTAGDPASLTLKVDATAPVVDAALPPATSVGQTATLVYLCTDAGSGLAVTSLPTAQQPTGCLVKIDGTAITATPTQVVVDGQWTGEWQVPIAGGGSTGSRTVTITATDNVGLATTVTRTLRVGWLTCLLYDATAEKNIGSNYTIKIQLCDQNGVNKSSNRIKLTALTIDGAIDPGPSFSGNSNTDYEFRFTRNDSSYTYNLDTTGLPAGIHQLYFTTETVTCPPPTPELPRGCTLAELQALATNSAEFRLK
jgi:hypothetical protein